MEKGCSVSLAEMSSELSTESCGIPRFALLEKVNEYIDAHTDALCTRITEDGLEYKDIAETIKTSDPDIIWVSLGAPKQEIFMARILPFLDRGLMLGIGAAFNFFVGDIAQPKLRIGAMRFNWLVRIFKEPKKQLRRVWNIMKVYPSLYRLEKKRIKK